MFANSKGQLLPDHLVAVGLMGYWKARSLGLDEEQSLITLMSGLQHDIGKADIGFNSHLMATINARSKKKEENGSEEEDFSFGAETGRDAAILSKPKVKAFAHHHEVSWATLCLAELLPEATGAFQNMHETVRWLVFHHHARKFWDRPVGTSGGKNVYYFPDSTQVLEAITPESRIKVAELCLAMAEKFHSLTGIGKMFFMRGGAATCLENAAERSSTSIPELFNGAQSRSKPKSLAIRSLQRSSLVWADRIVSSLSAAQTAHIASLSIKEAEEVFNTLNTQSGHPTLRASYTLGAAPSERTKLQEHLAKEAASHVTSVMAPPCGFGKSRIALLWFANLVQKRNFNQLLWVVPRNAIATGLATQMDEELASLGLSSLSWELFLGSTRVAASSNAPSAPFSANVIITNLDNILSPYVRHSWADRISDINSSAIVFDEFHEFASASPLFATFITLMAGRHNISRAPTLLLSATPTEIWPLWHAPTSEDVYLLPPVSSISQKNIAISLGSTMAAATVAVKDGGAAVMNSVAYAQSHHLESRTTMMAHSLYSPSDKEDVIKRVLTTFGKEACQSNSHKSISAGPIIQASLGVSFSTLVDSVCSPESTLQRLGRLDRFLTLDSPRYLALLIDPKESRPETSARKNVYDGELSDLWRGEIASFADGRTHFKMDEMVELYRSFSDRHRDMIRTWLTKLVDKSFAELNRVPPQRPVKKVQPTDGRTASKGNLRDPDGSYFVTAQIVNEIGSDTRLLGIDEVIGITKIRAAKIAEDLAGDRKALNGILSRINKAEIGFSYPTRGRGKQGAGQISDHVLTKDGLLQAARNPASPLPASTPMDDGSDRKERLVYHRSPDGSPGLGLVNQKLLYGSDVDGEDEDGEE